ncbi:hypothetical protein BCR39DRAFT_547008 [Naematelia encephala]|uniref:DUF1688-domain-containing protein n=1 Tax=Naematelia encephala TaxID=71784 RepID=A0A1Y2API4_9TREE|nr:hypothetical protein BCR39DRAFT_547008 [Naematelia encephala]
MTSSTPQIVNYLRSLEAVRDRSQQVFELAQQGKLDHWTWNQDKLASVVDYCAAIIERDFGTDYSKIPPHCRRNHFTTPTAKPINRISTLFSVDSFPTEPIQRAATLIDLYLVSVLLDAGAGPTWAYTETDEKGNVTWVGGRSEGLAVASWHMFVNGVFSGDKAKPLQVDSKGLKALTPDVLAKHLQVTAENPMAGLEGRCNLLIQLGSALEARPDICATGRPGDMLYYFASSLPATTPQTLPLSTLWSTLFDLLLPIWPARTTLATYPDMPLGDAWPCPALDKALTAQGKPRKDGDFLVPFHKLTQWLCYSLVEAIESDAGWKVDRGRGQTGLPEYRNGGLLVDLGVLSIKPESLPTGSYPNGTDKPPVIEPSHPAVVEWRAVTVIALDKIHELICEKLGVSQQVLSLAQVLEAATWKGGREIAKEKRAGGGPPVDIVSDGTVF